MPRPQVPTEERVIRALRVAKAITGPEQDAALEALSASVPCDKCDATGNSMPEGMPPMCNKCNSTGEMYVIR